MTVTTTPRTGQTQWGSGSDPLRRAQLNADADAAEAFFALDYGDTYTVLPAVGDIWSGRYVSLAPGAGTYRSLHRATGDHATWEQAIGNALPEPVYYRPHGAGDRLVGDVATFWTHPSITTPPGQITYDGQAAFARVRAFDPNSATRGSVYIGDDAVDLANLGRFYLKTRQAGDRGVVLQPHASSAGYMLAAREPGGQDVVTIDASGYLRARSLSGFGGGAVNASAAVVIAPTSASGDGVDNGLLLHGQSGATAKKILTVRRDLADTAPIFMVDRDNVALGRLPWGTSSAGANITESGRQVNIRAQGYDADPVLWRLWRTDASDPGNTGLDSAVAVLGRASGSIRVPLTLSQELGSGAAALVVQRYTDFSGRFLEFQRVTGGTEIISTLEADGRMGLGARWRGNGVMRDARQQVNHVTSLTNSVTINPGDSYTYTWPVMQLRSLTATDLKITGRMEAQVEAGAFTDKEDGQQWTLTFFISINGGAFNSITSVLMGGPAHRSGTRRPIEVQEGTCWQLNVAAGATIQMRTQVAVIGGAVPQVTHRRQWMTVEECIVQDYVSTP